MPENKLSKFQELIETAIKLGTLIAPVVALLTFRSGNRVASYFFIVLFCVLLDRYLWQTVRRKILAVLSILIVTLASAAWVVVNAWGFEVWPAGVWPARPEELLLLVARFDLQGTEKINPTRDIVGQLEAAIKDANVKARVAIVSTIANDDPAKAEAQAGRKGRIHQAIFVIWGNYNDAGFHPYFTITAESKNPLRTAGLEEVDPADKKTISPLY